MQQTRRKFLANSAAMGVLSMAWPGCVSPRRSSATASRQTPAWYRRTLRWGQTNITEADPPTYDLEWWRRYWKTTRVQGVIINAGGIVAYYPSKQSLQYRPATLGDRDLLGELVHAAHVDGLAVLARMDSNRAHENLYSAHSDWFAVDANGRPRKAGDLFIACINGPYYDDYLSDILKEIAQRYRPEGFADNSWSGLGRQDICYCENCSRRFHEVAGKALPARRNWDDAVYREWIEWNYARRLEIWDQNNRVTRQAGGPDCLWIGMNSGSIAAQSQSFRDLRGICARAEMVLLDHQARSDTGGFAENADAGQLVHALLGWTKLVPESMAMYQAGTPTFRKTSRPEPEARLWMLEGIAGGLQPWWHHVGALQEDRRQFSIAPPIYQWHEANQQFLVDREPLATVGLVWSRRNTDFFGRDQAREQVELPWRGWTQALLKARIQYVPIHADDLDRQAAGLSVLVLPNIGALSDSQAQSIRRFVGAGGSLIVSGRTGLYSEWGQPRADFALADLLGAHYVALGREGERPRELSGEALHTYLRVENESPQLGPRHRVLNGFEGTEILPFGGWLGDVIADDAALVPLTYVPAFPVYPPETSWMREPHTRVPGLVISSPRQRRVAFLVADIDRRFAIDNLPDHCRLLTNLVRWAAQDRFPIDVDGPGLIDCRVYRQDQRLIVHLVNLTGTEARRAPVDELIPIGPITLRVKQAPGIAWHNVTTLVRRDKPTVVIGAAQVHVTLPRLLDHEVFVIS